jgi:hypothetical protein
VAGEVAYAPLGSDALEIGGAAALNEGGCKIYRDIAHR